MKSKSMKNFILLFRHTGIIILLFIILFSGCRAKTPPVTFYTLSPLQEAATQKNLQSSQMISIGIGPVSLPDFLNKPQIVTRKGSSKIQYSEFHRWGGYLDKDFLRVMAENLSILLSTDLVRIYPWGSQADPDFQIEFDVKQFDGKLGNAVKLNVIWTVRRKDKSAKLFIAKRSIIQVDVAGDGHDALVSAYNQTLSKLSQEIASKIESASGNIRQIEN